ncbi:MAG TPA: hypothetical protein PLO51_06010, partial [Candidatus Micrarchaeota archaeon]|nr:hypothetical protein [Candidatus Micrarchaeota archaeon]
RKHAPAIEIKAPQDEPKGDMGPIERAFTKTSSLLLGRELHGIDNYEDYLKRHVKMRLVCKSPLSGRKAYLAGFMTNLAEIYGIGGSFVTEDEMIQIGRLNAGEKFPDSAKMDVDSLAKSLHPIAYSAMDDGVGISHNMIDCAMLLHSEDCYRTDGCAYSKKCAYNFWPRESEHIFGSWAVWESSFCMKGSQSKRLTRSMEIDTCESCADLYFSHNCENVNDSMFCFNTKNKKYAIGNSEFPRADYLKVKPAILAQLAGELESRRALKWDIFSLAAKP